MYIYACFAAVLYKARVWNETAAGRREHSTNRQNAGWYAMIAFPTVAPVDSISLSSGAPLTRDHLPFASAGHQFPSHQLHDIQHYCKIGHDPCKQRGQRGSRRATGHPKQQVAANRPWQRQSAGSQEPAAQRSGQRAAAHGCGLHVSGGGSGGPKDASVFVHNGPHMCC